MIKKLLLTIIALHSHSWLIQAQPLPKHDLSFPQLATSWDEGIPLGNGAIGALIWQQGDRLRFSLDRADVWDMRPMKGLDRKEFRYDWIHQKVRENDYEVVQQYFEAPYDQEPAPSKIPAGALEFNQPQAAVKSVRLSLQKALCEVEWENGMKLETFVHATQPVGWFRFTQVEMEIVPQLVAPPYESATNEGGEVNSLVGDDLSKLGYKTGTIEQNGTSITYRQAGWNGFTYEIHVQWKKTEEGTLEGIWSISSHYPGEKEASAASVSTASAAQRGYAQDFGAHTGWWTDFWSRSAISIPDPLLEKQWYLEQYKFGAAARRGGAARRSAHFIAGRLDGGQWQNSTVERGFSSRSEYPTQLLASLQRQSPGGGDGIYRSPASQQSQL